AGVVDPGVCHGATGAAHLLNRFYQATREELFLGAARHWIRQAVRYHAEGDPRTDQTAADAQTKDNGAWPTKPGLMNGLSGIGLGLLAAVSDVTPDWDRVLLASVPSR